MKKNLLFLTLFFCTTLYAETQPYRLSAGDKLEIHVIGHDDLTTKQSITPDGTLSIPMMGRITVSGKTLFELDDLLEVGLSRFLKQVHVVTELLPPEKTVYAENLPIYVVIHDLKKETWDVKAAKTSQEALAWTGGKLFTVNGMTPSLNMFLKPGDIVQIQTGKPTDFWESNWYKVLTGAAVITGIVKTLGKN